MIPSEWTDGDRTSTPASLATHVRSMTIDRGAEYLRLSPKAVRHRVALGTIPHRKLGGRILFDRVVIDAWFTNQPGLSETEAKAS